MYRDISPDLVTKIVEAFELQYKHRHNAELVSLEADVEAMRLQNAAYTRGQ